MSLNTTQQISTISIPQGRDFVAAHEGFVSKTYLCPAGVRTIGYGFTMGSKIFADYWRAKHGRALQMGDTITRAEADQLLTQLLNSEYGPPVVRAIAPKRQQHFDGATSVSFNCGPGALAWNWAKALAAGDVADAARRLRTTATTANGRQLAGLVRRRAEEADLIEHGRYAKATSPAPSTSDTRNAIREYQQMLADLGYDVGPVDGIAGTKTKAAVLRFQKEHGLVVDGVVGPATRAALIRALDTKRGKQATGGAGAAGGAGGVATVPDPATVEAATNALIFGAVAVVVVVAIVLFIKYRGRLNGQRVPT